MKQHLPNKDFTVRVKCGCPQNHWYYFTCLWRQDLRHQAVSWEIPLKTLQIKERFCFWNNWELMKKN